MLQSLKTKKISRRDFIGHFNHAILETFPQCLDQKNCNFLHSMEEVKKAISPMSTGKVSVKDEFVPKLYKLLDSAKLEAFYSVFTNILKKGVAMLFCIFKKRDNKADCGNYRNISLLLFGRKFVIVVLSSVTFQIANRITLVYCIYSPQSEWPWHHQLDFLLDHSL